jgi:hypothetical protein
MSGINLETPIESGGRGQMGDMARRGANENANEKLLRERLALVLSRKRNIETGDYTTGEDGEMLQRLTAEANSILAQLGEAPLEDDGPTYGTGKKTYTI